MNKEKQRRLGIVLSYVVLASNFIVGLVYTPYLIRSLGQSEYGNYNYVSSIANYLTLLTCGFGSAYLRFATPYRKNNDENGVASINGLFLVLFIVMGSVALLLGGIMTWKSDWILSGKLSSVELQTGKILMGILVVNVFTTFPISIFNSYIIAQEEFIFQKGLALFRTMLSPVLSIIVLNMGYKAIGIAIIALVVSIIIDSITVVFCFSKLHMKFNFSNIKFSQAKEVFVFSSFLLLSMIVDQINWSVDKYLLGKLCGTAVVAIYTVGSTINTYYKSVGEAISNVFVPKVYALLSGDNGDYEASKLMARLGRIQTMILALIVTGFIFFGKTFIELWVGKEYYEAYYVILLLIIPVTIPEIQKIGLEIQKAKNLHKFRSVAYAVIAVVNVLLTIPLAKAFGAVGAAFGTAITVLIGNGLIMNVYYSKYVNVDIKLFWKEVLKLFPAILCSASAAFVIRYVIKPNNWITFGISAFMYLICYCFIVFSLGLNVYEKQYVHQFISRNK